MNWGKWIIVAFILFVTFIGTLVTVCMKQDISLVSKNYYQDELVFDEQIKRVQNVTSLTQKPSIILVNEKVKVSFDRFGEMEQATLTLFRPSDSSKDKVFTIVPRAETTQTFSVNGLEGGMYRARLQWTMGDKEYFFEEVIYL